MRCIILLREKVGQGFKISSKILNNFYQIVLLWTLHYDYEHLINPLRNTSWCTIRWSADETIKITNYQSNELLIHFKGKLMEIVTIKFCNIFWHIYKAYLCHKDTQCLILVAVLSDSSLIVLQSWHLVWAVEELGYPTLHITIQTPFPTANKTCSEKSENKPTYLLWKTFILE